MTFAPRPTVAPNAAPPQSPTPRNALTPSPERGTRHTRCYVSDVNLQNDIPAAPVRRPRPGTFIRSLRRLNAALHTFGEWSTALWRRPAAVPVLSHREEKLRRKALWKKDVV